MSVPEVVPASPVMFERSVGQSLPKEGSGGDLLATRGEDGRCTLWFCTRGQEQDRPAVWAQVLLGTAVAQSGTSSISWPRAVIESVGGTGLGENPESALGEPDAAIQALMPGAQATFGEFGGGLSPDLAELLGAENVTHGDRPAPDDLARADVIAFELNGSAPATGQGWESCNWTFADGVTSLSVSWDGRAGAPPRDTHVVANGSIRGVDYASAFGLDSGTVDPVVSFLLFALPELSIDEASFTVTVSSAGPGSESTPDIDAIGLLTGHG